MLRSTKDLNKYSIGATDGEIGQVADVYFDDDSWVVRYLVVDTGTWLSSRKVLISPISVHQPNWSARTLPVSISMSQVKNGPAIDTDKPVSRQNEAQYLGYYGYAPYWGGSGMWGSGMYPYAMVPGYIDMQEDRLERLKEVEAYVEAERARIRHDDPHLRSCQAVTGYHIQATDGEIGHVEDFLIDEETWAIRYLVVNTSNWWGGNKVLISPQWIMGVHWPDQSVSVDVSRESVKRAPTYESTAELNRQGESKLFDSYGRNAYWTSGQIHDNGTAQ